MHKTRAYAALSPEALLEPFDIVRRAPGPHDVEITIHYCGVCHSDIHQARNEWQGTTYPCVPGHEIVGVVSNVGSGVRKFKLGEWAAIGCMVDSCRQCESCQEGEEQFCDQGPTWTYNAEDRILGGMTYGGYSRHIVADEAFVLSLPTGLDPQSSAPLLCAGITTYSPLRYWNVRKGQRIGVVGLGGLGHMAIKFANAFGAEVVLFTTSPDKAEDAVRLGASEVVLSKDINAMSRQPNRFDFILDTVSAEHDLNIYLKLLKRNGTLALVGVPPDAAPIAAPNLIFGRHQLAGSLIGGIEETQAMLHFCAEHGITSDIELISMANIDKAYERILRSDVRYRFVIDMATLT